MEEIVHALGYNYDGKALCETGNGNYNSRSVTTMNWDNVTCEKCLAEIAKLNK